MLKKTTSHFLIQPRSSINSKIISLLEKHSFFLFMLWTLWVSLEFIPYGPGALIRVSDTADSYIPVLVAKKILWAKYGITHWINFMMGGLDNWAWCEEPFHIFESLPFLMPVSIWYFLIMFGQRWFAAFFTFRLCKDRMKWSAVPSLFCGMAYSLTFWPQHGFHFFDGFGAPALPFYVWTLCRIAEIKNPIRAHLFAGSMGIFLAVTTYVPGGPLFLLPIILVLSLMLLRGKWLRFLSLFFIFSLTSILCDIPYVWATFVHLSHSTRATIDYTLPGSIGNPDGRGVWANYKKMTSTFAIKHAFLLIVTCCGLLVSKFRSRQLWVFFAFTLFCSFGALLYFPLHSHLRGFLNALRGFGFYKIYVGAPFFVVLAAGKSIELLISSIKKYPDALRASIAICGLIFPLSFFIIFQSLTIKRNAYRTYANIALISNREDLLNLRRQTNEDIYRVATAFTEDRWLPHYALFYGFEIADGYLSIYSKRYHDFWGKVIEPLTRSDKLKYNYFHNWRNKAYLFSPTSETLTSDLTHSDTAPYGESIFANFYNLNLLSLANVRFVLSRRPLKDLSLKLISSEGDPQDQTVRPKWERFIDTLKGAYKGKKLYIYENKDYLPRFFLAERVQRFGDDAQLLEALSRMNTVDLHKTVLVSEYESLVEMKDLSSKEKPVNEIIVSLYSPDKIKLEIQTNKPSVLVHSSNFSPYWRAFVNGEETSIFPAYHTFQGLRIPKGVLKVTLLYCPPYALCKADKSEISGDA